MHDFEYVPKEEWKPIRDELFEIIHRLQKKLEMILLFNIISWAVANER
ncbi:MAG: hypothetical protein V8S08_04500 [Lachnoclostridium sp.]